MDITEDERETDTVALMEYIESCIKREIDELVSLGSYDELQRVKNYVLGHEPVRHAPSLLILAEHDRTVEMLRIVREPVA